MTPKEREELQREADMLRSDLKQVDKIVADYTLSHGAIQSRLAEQEAKLAEPEDWVPGRGDAYEFILPDGLVSVTVHYGLNCDRNAIAFNNFFQPGTGQAEAIRDVEGPMRAIWKTAWELGLNAMEVFSELSGCQGILDARIELRRLCSTEIDTVRNWKGKS